MPTGEHVSFNSRGMRYDYSPHVRYAPLCCEKTDAADAQGIWTALQQPGACLVAIKQADQQAILSLHRIRAQLLKFRIMQSNGLRGLL